MSSLLDLQLFSHFSFLSFILSFFFGLCGRFFKNLSIGLSYDSYTHRTHRFIIWRSHLNGGILIFSNRDFLKTIHPRRREFFNNLF